MNQVLRNNKSLLTILVLVLIFSLSLPLSTFAKDNALEEGFSPQQQIALDFLSKPAVEKKYAEIINEIGRASCRERV